MNNEILTKEIKILANVLNQYPGIEVNYQSMENFEICLDFKCCNQLSLATISVNLNESTPEENLHIDKWSINVSYDADYATVYYSIKFPEDEKILFQDLPKLIKKLKEELNSETYLGYKNLIENKNNMGVPDLSFVTISEMTCELDQRDINYCLLWINKNTKNITYLANKDEFKTMFKLMKKYYKIKKLDEE